MFGFYRRRQIWPDAAAPPEAGPDFLCVGMVKSGTSWLFHQLREHPDFWMPPIKEVRYLHRDRAKMDNTRRRLQKYRSDAAERLKASAADVAFVEEAAVLAGRPVDLERYAALFRLKGKRLSGDISPGYYQMTSARIAQVAARFPALKVLLLARDPVLRVWSHISMAHREGRFPISRLRDAETFRAWFAASKIREASFATGVAERWRQHAPGLAFRHVLYDRIAEDAIGARREIISFLGANPRRKGAKPPTYNPSARQQKLVLTEPFRTVLAEELAREIHACAEMFGGAAKEWPARYGL